MFITVVNGQVTHFSSLEKVADSLRSLDTYASAYVEVFEHIGNGCDVLKIHGFNQDNHEKGEGITPDNLDKYRHRIG